MSRIVTRFFASFTERSIAVLFVTSAHATGTNMPWEAPLQNILDSVQGPVAKPLRSSLSS